LQLELTRVTLALVPLGVMLGQLGGVVKRVSQAQEQCA
jgi:hypothetical protein